MTSLHVRTHLSLSKVCIAYAPGKDTAVSHWALNILLSFYSSKRPVTYTWFVTFLSNQGWLQVQVPQMSLIFSTLMLRQNGLHFTNDIFKCILLNEKAWILISISLKFFFSGDPIDNKSTLVWIMAWQQNIIWSSDGLTHTCVIQQGFITGNAIPPSTSSWFYDLELKFFIQTLIHIILW